MSKYIPQYVDEKINKLGFIIFGIFLIFGYFSLVGYILRIVRGDFYDRPIFLELFILIVLLPSFTGLFISRLKNVLKNRKIRKVFLEHGQKLSGEIEKILTERDREKNDLFKKRGSLFDPSTFTLAIVKFKFGDYNQKIKTPPLSYMPEVGEPVDVYFYEGKFYVNNPRIN